MISFWQLIIVLVIVLLIFGPSRLEKLGPALGKTIKGFKKGIKDSDSDNDKSKDDAIEIDQDDSSKPT